MENNHLKEQWGKLSEGMPEPGYSVELRGTGDNIEWRYSDMYRLSVFVLSDHQLQELKKLFHTCSVKKVGYNNEYGSVFVEYHEISIIHGELTDVLKKKSIPYSK